MATRVVYTRAEVRSGLSKVILIMRLAEEGSERMREGEGVSRPAEVVDEFHQLARPTYRLHLITYFRPFILKWFPSWVILYFKRELDIPFFFKNSSCYENRNPGTFKLKFQLL